MGPNPKAPLPSGDSGGAVQGRLVVGEQSELRAYVDGAVRDGFEQLKLDLLEVLRPAEPPRPPLREVVDAWIARVTPLRVVKGAEIYLAEHLGPLLSLTERTLTAAHVEARLLELRATLSANTTNKVRSVGRLAVDHALASRVWNSPNPFALARRQKEVAPQYELLTLEELAAVQRHLRPDRRRLFRVDLHLGLRPGEAFALQARDVDAAARVIHVRRSHGRDTTKTGTIRTVPLVAAVASDVLAALEEGDQTNPARLLFPRADGSRHRYDTKLCRVLRTAMAKAGVGLVSITYKCRRCGRSLVDAKPPLRVEERPCGACGASLWPVPKVRPVRWYDLRHMCATFHHRAGADPLCVALALGHSVKGTTHSTYTHPDNATMLRELSRWSLP